MYDKSDDDKCGRTMMLMVLIILVNDDVDEDEIMMMILSFDYDREGILCYFFIPGTMSKGKRKRDDEEEAREKIQEKT